MDKSHIKFVIQMKISDMIFQQHMRGCYRTCTVILIIQLLNAIGMAILNAIFKFNSQVVIYATIMSFVLCALVIINNAIHKKAWDKAKEEAEDIYIGLSLMTIEDTKTQKELLHKICPTIPED